MCAENTHSWLIRRSEHFIPIRASPANRCLCTHQSLSRQCSRVAHVDRVRHTLLFDRRRYYTGTYQWKGATVRHVFPNWRIIASVGNNASVKNAHIWLLPGSSGRICASISSGSGRLVFNGTFSANRLCRVCVCVCVCPSRKWILFLKNSL